MSQVNTIVFYKCRVDESQLEIFMRDIREVLDYLEMLCLHKGMKRSEVRKILREARQKIQICPVGYRVYFKEVGLNVDVCTSSENVFSSIPFIEDMLEKFR